MDLIHPSKKVWSTFSLIFFIELMFGLFATVYGFKFSDQSGGLIPILTLYNISDLFMMALYFCLTFFSSLFFVLAIILRKKVGKNQFVQMILIITFITITAFWMLTDHFGGNNYFPISAGLRMASFVSFHLMPFPILLYICSRLERNSFSLYISLLVGEISFLLNFVYMILNGFNFSPFKVVVLAWIFLSIAFTLIILSIERFKHKNNECLYALIGIGIVSIGALINLVLSYRLPHPNNALWSTFSIVIMLLLLFYGEVKRAVDTINQLTRKEIASSDAPTPICLSSIDSPLAISYYNKEFKTFFDFKTNTADEGTADISSLFSESDLPRIQFSFKSFVRNQTESFSLEAKMRLADKQFHWVHCQIKANYHNMSLTSVFSDIDILKSLTEKVRLSEEEFRITTQHNDKYVFKYDLKTHSIIQQKNPSNPISALGDITNAPNSIIDQGIVALDGTDAFTSFFKAMETERSGECVVKIGDSSNQNAFSWYRFQFTSLKDSSGVPLHSIVTFFDVTEQREKELGYERIKQEMKNVPAQNISVFDYNLTNGTLESSSGKLFSTISHESGTKTFNEVTQIRALTVHPEDKHAFISLMDSERLQDELYQGITTHQLDFRHYMGNNIYHWLRLNIQLVRYQDTGEIKAFITVRDINEMKLSEIEVIRRAERDDLTGAYKRNTFISLSKNILTGDIFGKHHGLYMLDLDDFKVVNDTLGHKVGDKLLIDTVEKIRSVFRPNDNICRLGGDEFVVIIQDVPNKNLVEKRAQELATVLHTTFEGLNVSASIGISMYPEDGLDFESLYLKADKALYYAKEHQKGTYVFYSPDMVSISSDRF